MVATQLKHSWTEDALNPNTATATNDAAGTLDTTETTMTVNLAGRHDQRFRVGTIFKDAATGKSEVMRVTGIGTTTPFTLTIERGFGGGFTAGTGEAHAAAFSIMIIAHTKQEDWKPTQEDWSQERTGLYNYLSTMGYGINISRTRQAISYAGIPSEFAHQAAYRLKEYMRQLDSSLINSIRSETEGGAADYSSMMGLIDAVRYGCAASAVATGNVTTTSEALTPSVINAMIKQIWDDGGMVAGGRLFCLVGGVQKRKISAFDNAYRRMDFDSKAAGYVVERFLSDLGFEVEVITDPWVQDDTIIVGDLNRVRLGPLQTDAVALEDLAKTGRAIEAMVSGSYTCEFRNALEAFAYHSSLQS